MMTPERRNEIALKFVEQWFRDKGISSLKKQELNRQAGNMAKELGISIEEAWEFVTPIVRKLVDEAFPQINTGKVGFGS